MPGMELKPQLSIEDVKEEVRKITGVVPDITICQNSRIAMTIDKELTLDEQAKIERLMSPIRTYRGPPAGLDELKARVEKLERRTT